MWKCFASQQVYFDNRKLYTPTRTGDNAHKVSNGWSWKCWCSLLHENLHWRAVKPQSAQMLARKATTYIYFNWWSYAPSVRLIVIEMWKYLVSQKVCFHNRKTAKLAWKMLHAHPHLLVIMHIKCQMDGHRSLEVFCIKIFLQWMDRPTNRPSEMLLLYTPANYIW